MNKELRESAHLSCSLNLAQQGSETVTDVWSWLLFPRGHECQLIYLLLETGYARLKKKTKLYELPLSHSLITVCFSAGKTCNMYLFYLPDQLNGLLAVSFSVTGCMSFLCDVIEGQKHQTTGEFTVHCVFSFWSQLNLTSLNTVSIESKYCRLWFIRYMLERGQKLIVFDRTKYNLMLLTLSSVASLRNANNANTPFSVETRFS